MRKLIFFGLALGLVTFGGVAAAQYPAQPLPPPPAPPTYGYPAPAPVPAPRPRFGNAGELVISSDANLGLTGQVDGGVNGSPATSGWTLTLHPSADYFVIQGLSVGAFVDFTHTEYDQENQTNGIANGTGTTAFNTNRFGVGPRVGYNIPIVDWISVWPTLGLAFAATGQTGGVNGTAWTLVLSAPFLYHLATHFFVGLGPFLSADWRPTSRRARPAPQRPAAAPRRRSRPTAWRSPSAAGSCPKSASTILEHEKRASCSLISPRPRRAPSAPDDARSDVLVEGSALPRSLRSRASHPIAPAARTTLLRKVATSNGSSCVVRSTTLAVRRWVGGSSRSDEGGR